MQAFLWAHKRKLKIEKGVSKVMFASCMQQRRFHSLDS